MECISRGTVGSPMTPPLIYWGTYCNARGTVGLHMQCMWSPMTPPLIYWGGGQIAMLGEP